MNSSNPHIVPKTGGGAAASADVVIKFSGFKNATIGREIFSAPFSSAVLNVCHSNAISLLTQTGSGQTGRQTDSGQTDRQTDSGQTGSGQIGSGQTGRTLRKRVHAFSFYLPAGGAFGLCVLGKKTGF